MLKKVSQLLLPTPQLSVGRQEVEVISRDMSSPTSGTRTYIDYEFDYGNLDDTGQPVARVIVRLKGEGKDEVLYFLLHNPTRYERGLPLGECHLAASLISTQKNNALIHFDPNGHVHKVEIKATP